MKMATFGKMAVAVLIVKNLAFGQAPMMLPDKFSQANGKGNSDTTLCVSDSSKNMPKKMKAYPVLSGQGLTQNPAFFNRVGDWVYVSGSAAQGAQGPNFFVQGSKGFNGVRLVGSSAGGNWSIAGMGNLAKKLDFGVQVSSGANNPKFGITYTFVHDSSLAEAGLDYDVPAKTARTAAEYRFFATQGLALTFSAQITASFAGNAGGLGNSNRNISITSTGAGFQFATENVRISTGTDGTNTTVAYQLVIAGVYPDGGVTFGKGASGNRIVSGWVGVLFDW